MNYEGYREIRGAGANEAVMQGVMTRVYTLMTIGLFVTAGVSFVVTHSEGLFSFFCIPMIFFGLMIAELGIVFFLGSRVMTLSEGTARALFFSYAALNGITLSPMLYYYAQTSSGAITQAFFSTAAMFGGMTAYAMITKRDLSGWGSFLGMGIIGLLIAMLVNLFVGGERTSLVISCMAVIIFSGLTAYDTWKIRTMASEYGGSSPEGFAIFGALQLYLDFINLFIHLLRIMGRRK